MSNEIDLTKLSQPLPAESISKHPTKPYLSSIKAVYVTERFNEVFGIGKWSTKVKKEHVNHENGMVVVKVIFQVPTLNIYYESYGGNDNGGSNSKNFDLGDAYKGATTDAITKIGSFLGVAIDVFKGKTTANGESNANNSNTSSNNDDNKPWLNKADNQKNFTKEWLNVVAGINKGTIKDVAKVREHYKVSKATEEQLNEVFNLK